MSVPVRFAIFVAVIVASTALGYLSRRSGRVPESIAGALMTLVAAVGYPAVGFLSIWSLRLSVEDAWLPVLGCAHTAVMTALSLAGMRLLTADRGEIGLFGIAGPWGNTGFTMGGFVVYLLCGEAGLGRAGVLGLMWTPMVVLLMYPIARRYAGQAGPASLGKLMLRNLLDWRSLGLPASALAVGLSIARVPRPAWIETCRLVDVLMYVILPLAYFSIGIRLRVSDIGRSKRPILALAAARFALAPLTAWALALATRLTSRPLAGQAWDVFLIESVAPLAVTTVAVANMFDLRPRQASMLFVVNTIMYLAAVLPVVAWVFG